MSFGEPLTVLRLKRPHTQAALDAVHITRPTKRARHGTSTTTEPLKFRRLPATTELSSLGLSRVIDVDASLLTRTADPHGEVLCNGEAMTRELVNGDADEVMCDLFVPGTEMGDVLLEGSDTNVAWLEMEDLPVFGSDEEEERGEDSEGSVDYPSTPDGSDEEWGRRRVSEVDEEECGDRSERDWREWCDDESEQEGDNYDYEA